MGKTEDEFLKKYPGGGLAAADHFVFDKIDALEERGDYFHALEKRLPKADGAAFLRAYGGVTGLVSDFDKAVDELVHAKLDLKQAKKDQVDCELRARDRLAEALRANAELQGALASVRHKADGLSEDMRATIKSADELKSELATLRVQHDDRGVALESARNANHEKAAQIGGLKREALALLGEKQELQRVNRNVEGQLESERANNAIYTRALAAEREAHARTKTEIARVEAAFYDRLATGKLDPAKLEAAIEARQARALQDTTAPDGFVARR